MTDKRTRNPRDCIADSYYRNSPANLRYKPRSYGLYILYLFAKAFHILMHSSLFGYFHNRLEDRASIDLGSGKWREKKHNAHKI